MESLFDKQTTQKFIARINNLTPHSKAQWGKMNVSQMLHHCQKPLNIASGALVIKVNPIIKFLFGKGARKKLLSEPQFGKNLPTFNEAIVKDQRDFEIEKKKLIETVEAFQKNGVNGIMKDPHPFFGDLTTQEWEASQTKHLDHHLRQFGV